MTTYTVNLRNETGTTWVFTLFQRLPNQPQLTSVAWLLRTLPGPGGSGSIPWDDALAVVIADFDAATRVFSQTHLLPAQAGEAFEVVVASGIQQLRSDGDSPAPSTVLVRNRSGLMANPGLGMAQVGAIYAKGVLSGANALFETAPVYWIALFDQITQGEQLILPSSVRSVAQQPSVFVGPEPVVFPAGTTSATATAAISGQTISLTVTYP